MARFIYYNINPKGEREEDCVTRAIALATQLPYEEIAEKLTLTAELLNCDRLYICCYRHLLDTVFRFEQIDGDGFTIGEFADEHPYGTYLVRTNGHLTTVIDGEVYDIWDCRNEWVTDAWRVD